MNQRTTVPPFGPGPAATGAGVMSTVDGDGSGVWLAAAAWLAAALDALGLGDAELLHAPTRMAVTARPAKTFFVPDRVPCIALISSCGCR
jgi:hypothetical protein